MPVRVKSSWKLIPSGDSEQSGPSDLASDLLVAGSLVGLAFGFRFALGLLGGHILIFAVCYPVLMIATLFAGLRCGVITLVLTTLIFSWAFVPPGYSLELGKTSDLVNIGLYIGAGGFIVWISHGYRAAIENYRQQKIHNDLLTRELQHRSKNSLAVISSIVKQSLKEDRAASEKIIGRINALKSGDDLLTGENAGPQSIGALIRREVGFYDSTRVTFAGTDFSVDGALGKTICMVTHELATNAIKYGAWSNKTGRIQINWNAVGDRGEVIWAEEGGPTVAAPMKPGFGTFLIERLLSQHNGKVEVSIASAGLVCTLHFGGIEFAAHEGGNDGLDARQITG